MYAPPGIDWSLYKRLINMMFIESQGVLICGGDMNLSLPKMDSSNPNLGHSKPRINKVNSVIEIGIIDVWRDLYPTSRHYTHFSVPDSTYSRIDYFFTFKRDSFRLQSCDSDMSDQSLIEMIIKISNNP